MDDELLDPWGASTAAPAVFGASKETEDGGFGANLDGFGSDEGGFEPGLDFASPQEVDPGRESTEWPDNAQGSDGESEFGDFGEEGNSGGDSDFGEFADETAFESAPQMSTALHPPLELDFLSPKYLDASEEGLPAFFLRKTIKQQLSGFVTTPYADAPFLTNDVYRETDSLGQILASKSAVDLFTKLTVQPSLKPLDWRRSKIRRAELIALGLPVNLDELAAPVAHFARTSTPLGRTATVPIVDKIRIAKLTSLEDLHLKSVQELEEIKNELDRISLEAGTALTQALLDRDRESTDSETYNGMIQDLVAMAAKSKLKTTSTTAGSSTTTGPSKWATVFNKS